MTVTAKHPAPPSVDGARVPPWHPSQPQHELAADVRWWMGMPVAFGLYGRLALDQVAYREAAAAVDATGRLAENLTNRGFRRHLWGPPLLFRAHATRRAPPHRPPTHTPP